MRASWIAVVAVGVAAAPAAADAPAGDGATDGATIGAAIGAGGQGTATYGALELRFDAAWRGARLGLAARGVWEDGVFRRDDWDRLADAVAVVRYLEAHTDHVGVAAGALAPAQLGHVADGTRASLDDRPRTGARIALTTPRLEVGAEVDDLIDPALIGGAAGWALTPTWGLRAAAAVDPTAPAGATSAIEAGAARRWQGRDRRVELGAGVVVEPNAGVAALAAFGAEADRGSARWSVRGDVRVGSGTNGAAFGPLHRLERLDLRDRARAGVGAGLVLGVAAPVGWVALGARARPGMGPLGTLTAGLPVGRYVQAGGWVAASPSATAGAAELRIAWARRLFSALQVARMYATDEMQPVARWSATAWFGATTD